MLAELWGHVMALAVITLCFSIFMWIARKIIGDFGVALVMVLWLGAMAWAGLSWLIHNDSLGLQMLGWALAGFSVWATLKAVQILGRKVRAWWTENDVDESDEVVCAGFSEPLDN
jgi:energy-coupling factor transporter transmembrane protein EcfT